MEQLKYATLGEAFVVRRLVRHLLSMGYSLSVNDGWEWPVKGSTDGEEVLNALCATEEETIEAINQEGGRMWFTLVWGNDKSGEELIADHNDSLEAEKAWSYATCIPRQVR